MFSIYERIAMKLYYAPGACSLSPHIVLREAVLEVALEKGDMKTRKVVSTGTPFADIHPKGYVPVLELDNGERLTEGAVIVQYLADQKPASGLLPQPGTMERYRVLEWLNYTTSELHKSFTPLFRPHLPLDDWRKAAREKIASCLAWVNSEIGERPYLMGEQFTVADAYLFTVVNWTNAVGIDLAQWPNLARYHARVAARPHVQAALQAEGITVKTVA